MRLAGIKKAFIILRDGKWDIPSYLGDGSSLDMHLGYLMLGLPFGVPYTLDQAYPFVQDAIVALGYPDTLFGSDDAFGQLLTRQAASADDLVLGIFPADRPQKVDMVDIGDDGQIRQIVIKPRQTHLRYKWAIAVWTPVFTHFMHQYLTNLQTPEETQREVQIGEVFQAAIDSNLRVRGVHVSDEPLLDIGTADDLLRAVRRFISDQK
jgi:glucose-1-phosphate thymidylyltransferase